MQPGSLKNLTCKRIGKRPLGRPSRRWEDNVRMDLEEHMQGIGILERPCDVVVNTNVDENVFFEQIGEISKLEGRKSQK